MTDAPLFCEQCGSRLSDGVAFCEDCGAAVPAAEPTSARVPETSTPAASGRAPAASGRGTPRWVPLAIGLVGILLVVVSIVSAL